MLRVALVDDSPAHSAELSELLDPQRGVEVTAAGSLGSDIVDLLTQEPPDIVLLDPPAQPETIRRLIDVLHAALPHTRVVVTSLDDNHDHIREIWAASGEAFVPRKRLFREPKEALSLIYGPTLHPN